MSHAESLVLSMMIGWTAGLVLVWLACLTKDAVKRIRQHRADKLRQAKFDAWHAEWVARHPQ